MGVWGTGLYDNDTAQDVKDMCEDIFPFVDIETGNEIIFREFNDLIESKKESIDNDYVSFWYALADWQWKHGILTEVIRRNALELLALSKGESEWENKNDVNRRKNVLNRLKEQLLTNQPARKIRCPKLNKPKHIPGDIIIFKTCSKSEDIGDHSWSFNSCCFGRACLFESEQIRNADYSGFQPRDDHDMYMAIICVGTVKVPHSDFLPEIYDEYSVYAYYDYISSNKPEISDLQTCGFLPYIYWRVNQYKTEVLEWGYCFYLYCDDSGRSNSDFIVEITRNEKETERYHNLKNRKKYGDFIEPFQSLRTAYYELMEEKQRSIFIGYPIDNLLDMNCINPKLLNKEKVVIPKV